MRETLIRSEEKALNPDPRSRRTRELLKNAMCTLMKQKSIASISVTDITETATVNRATFYSHFTDKQALLETCVRDWFREHMAERVSSDAPYDRVQVGALLSAVGEFLSCWNRPNCRMSHRELNPLLEATIQSELYNHIQDWLGKAIPQIHTEKIPLDPICTLFSWSAFGAGKKLSTTTGAAFEELTEQFVLAIMSEGIFSSVKSHNPFSS